MPAGVNVGFCEGDPDQGGALLGSGVTSKPLYTAEGQDVVLELPTVQASFVDGSKPQADRGRCNQGSPRSASARVVAPEPQPTSRTCSPAWKFSWEIAAAPSGPSWASSCGWMVAQDP